jgi:hypothetical protein
MGRQLERRSRDFRDQEVEACLTALALSSGNATKAARGG